MTDVTKSNKNTLLAAGADYSTLIHIDRITDNTGTKQGLVVDGGLTDDLQPTLSGYLPGSEGLHIRVFLNGSVAGYTEVEADGTWSFTPETPLVAGTENAFQVSLIDPANGNTQWLSNEYNLTTTEANQDGVTAPDAPVITNVYDDAGAQTGNVANGGQTDDKTVLVSGTAEANSTVHITMYGPGGHPYDLGTVKADSTGKWSLPADIGWTYKGLNSFTFEATATDAAGNTSEQSGQYVVNWIETNQDDVTAPDAPVITAVSDDTGSQQGNVANGGLTDDKTVLVSGTAEANSTVHITMYGPGGYAYDLGTVMADGTGQWSLPADIGWTHKGLNSFTFEATATDAAGNTSEQSSQYVVNWVEANQDDTTAPDAPQITAGYDDAGSAVGDLANGATTDDTTPALRGTAEANSIVTIYDNGNEIGTVIAAADGSWNYTPSALGEGSHTFTATAADAAGHVSDKSDGFELNIGSDTHTDKPVISSYLDDVGIKQGEVTTGGRTDDDNGLLSGHAEAGSVVKLTMWGPQGVKYTNVGSAIADVNGEWHIQLSDTTRLLGNTGSWKFQITATDQAGNSATSERFTLEYVGSNQDAGIASNAPVITSAFDDFGSSQGYISNGSTTNDTTPTLSGTATANSIVYIYDNGKLLDSVTANDNGDWSFTPSARSEGMHTFIATDAEGNISDKSAGFNVNIDTAVQIFSEDFRYEKTKAFDQGGTYIMEGFKINVLASGYHPQHTYRSGFSNSASDPYGSPLTESHIRLTDGTRLKLDMNQPVDALSFTVGNVSSEVLTVKYYSDDNRLLGTKEFHASQDAVNFKYEAPVGEKIGWIQLDDNDWGNSYLWIDNVKGYSIEEPAQPELMPTSYSEVQSSEPHDAAMLSDVTLATLPEGYQQSVVDLHDNIQNKLILSLNDILSEAHDNLFIQDGKQQLAITGDAGDVVELKVEDIAHDWQDAGQVTAGGVQYEVYQHADLNVELLVQQGVELQQVS